MKCLFYGEVPSIETGAARISQHLLNLMMELEGEIDVVGINGFDDLPHDEDKWPFRFFDVNRDNPRDPEKAYNMKNAEEQILKGDYDVLFLTGDIQYIYAVLNWAFEARAKFHTTIIALVVIDSDFDMPYLHEVAQCDVIAVYSKFAQDVFERRYPPVKGKLLCTTLGCEIDSYYPLTPEQRRKVREEAFKVSDDTFLVGIFNRNQYRKDIMRGAYAFHLFHQQYPNSVLFICAQRRDL